jgi:hypothetical protein
MDLFEPDVPAFVPVALQSSRDAPGKASTQFCQDPVGAGCGAGMTHV